MWEDHPNVFLDVGDIATSGMEFFQLSAFPCTGIEPRTHRVAPIDVEICQIGTWISKGNDCIVSDVFAVIEANPCDAGRVDIVIVDNINNEKKGQKF